MTKTEKIKGVLLIIIMAFLIVFMIGIISYFAEADNNYGTNWDINVNNIKMNDKFKFNLTDLSEGRKDGKLYCVEHKQHMSQWFDVKYEVANIIEIEGRTATGYKKNGDQKDIPGDWNARLAAAIHFSNVGKADDYNTNQRQKAIWYYLYDWTKNVGSDFWNIDTSKIGSNDEGLADGIQNKVEKYVEEINDASKKITDKSGDIGYIDIIDNEYIRVGYFKLDFAGKLVDIEVKGKTVDNDKIDTIGGIKFRQGGDIKKVSEIKANEDFCILIPLNKNVKEISKITFNSEAKLGIIKAKIVILETEQK